MAELEFVYDRNFAFLEEKELNADQPLSKQLETTWFHEEFVMRQTINCLVVANGKSAHLKECLDLESLGFAHVATMKVVDKPEASGSGKRPADIDESGVKMPSQSQFVCDKAAEPISVYANYDAAATDRTSGRQRVVVVCIPHIPPQCSALVSEFLVNHFITATHPVVVLDFLAKGHFAQATAGMQLPLLRTVQTTALRLATADDCKADSSAVADTSHSTDLKPECSPLETGNLITTTAAAVIQSCEWRDIEATLFVSVSDLPFLGESLADLSLAVFSECHVLRDAWARNRRIVPDNFGKIKESVAKTCSKWGDDRLDLNPGVVMFF